jgi:hypothetical protein
MSPSSFSATSDLQPMRSLGWTQSEKAIARRIFDDARQAELGEMMAETRRRAAAIRVPADLWYLETYLRESRQQFDRKYDYRYSVLPAVFGLLLSEGRISEAELQGLREDKLSWILREGRAAR